MGFVLLLLLIGCGANKTTEVPILTTTPLPTLTQTVTRSQTPRATNTPISTLTPSLTATPPEKEWQVTLGLPYSAINNNGCGGTGVVTVDYDLSKNWLDFWGKHPDFPEPTGFTHRSRDGRIALDYCTHIGFPISWALEVDGIVDETRPDEGIAVIRISAGPLKGFGLVLGHVSLDINLENQGMQNLIVGTIVHYGDIVAYTDRYGIASGSDSSTQTGLLQPNGGYHPQQEMMLIGNDGQPNILYDK